MPAHDKTGPQGVGSMSGRGMGNCTKHIAAQANKRNCGNGLKQRNGNRFAHGFNQTVSNDNEILFLKKQIEVQQDQLNTMKLCLDGLKN